MEQVIGFFSMYSDLEEIVKMICFYAFGLTKPNQY
jgi:hypothetical protein